MYNAKVIYLSGITLAIFAPNVRQKFIQNLEKSKSNGQQLVAYDSNYRPNLWEDKKTAQDVTATMWLIANMALFDEAEDEVIARFSAKNWERIVIKRCIDGPLSPSLLLYPVFPVVKNVADTTAAGESFNVDYLAAYFMGSKEQTCLSKARSLAAKPY